MAESRFWRCEGCDCVLMDFNRPVGQEQVREYRCDSEDDNRYCLDCCKKAEDSAAPTPETPPGAPGMDRAAFRDRVAGCAFAWAREPDRFEEFVAALWANVSRRVAEARAETLTECIAVAEDEAKHQKSLTAHAESKGQGVMHFCAGEGADRVVARLAALPVPAAAPEAESRPTSPGGRDDGGSNG